MIRNNKSLRNPKLGVSYVRVSTHVQEQSILAQNQRLDRHVLLNETILVRKFEDEAKSGRKLLVKRPGGCAMLAYVRDHPEVGTLVVTTLDRLGRNAIDIQRNYIYLTKELGVGVVIVDFGGKVFDSTDLMADFFITVMSAIAQLEIDRTSKRIKDVLNGKFARGESLGGKYAPYGYDKVPNGNTRMKKDGTLVHIKILVNNEEEQDALSQMKQLQAQGRSAREIKEWLNENGIPTKSGQAWTVSRTDKVLRSAHTARLWTQWSRENSRQ